MGMVKLTYGPLVTIPARTTHLVDGISQVDQRAINQLILFEASDTHPLPGGWMVKRGVAKTSFRTKVSVKLLVANETEHSITIPWGTVSAQVSVAAAVAHTAPIRNIIPIFDQEKLNFGTPQFLHCGKRG